MPTGQFLLSVFRIVLIDLLLAGDNALVIAMAVRSLPRRERRIGTAGGAALAVLIRAALTLIAAELLTIEYLKLAGGLFVLWIAWRVLADICEEQDPATAPKRLLQAIWYVVVADLTMSVDNILAIAGAAGGHFGLILFGLALSIPFVVFSSNLLADLMNRFPVVIYVGVAILGQVGAEMVLTDPSLARAFHPSAAIRYAIEAGVVAALLLAGWRRRRRAPC